MSAVDVALAHAIGSGIDTAEVLAEEVARIRSLPIIQTCGACGWLRPEPAEQWRCGHRDAKPGNIIRAAAPPTWCPLRGEKARTA